MKGLTGLLFILLLTSNAVNANDTAYGEVNGTIQLLKQNDVSMEKERLLISPQRINVDYLFVNHSSQDVTLPVAFPMPPKSFNQDVDQNPGISNFKLSVNGKPVKPQVRWVAQLLDKHGNPQEDITDKLKQAGWTVEQLRDALARNDGVIQADNLPALPDAWTKSAGSHLTVQQYFIWQQTFPAGKEVMINHAYTPSQSSGVPQEFEYISDEQCLTKDNRRQLSLLRDKYEGTHKERFPGFFWSELSYILTTGANWKGGVIGDFTLRIHKDAADAVAVVCFNHPLIQADPMTMEFKQRNFKPEHDLSVLYLSAPY